MKKIRWKAGAGAGVFTLSLLFVFAGTALAGTVPSGFAVEGFELAGMSREDAAAALEEAADAMEDCTVTLTLDGQEIETTAGDLGLFWENQEEVEEALDGVAGGNLLRRYLNGKKLESEPVSLSMEMAVDEARVAAFAAGRLKAFEHEAQDAAITRADGAFQITPSAPGIAVDAAATAEALNEAVKDGLTEPVTVAVAVTETQPARTTEQLSVIQDVLGTFSTNFNAGNVSRSKNVTNGAAKINGCVLMPGEEFSAYVWLTPFTVENGYAAAASYANGQVIDTVGGGACQICTTLYNAALLSEMEITQRQNHSMIVTYVKPSQDAAIAGTVKDLKFKNPYETPVYIEGIVEGGTLTFTIYGQETRPANREIKFVSETLGTSDPGAPITRVDPSLAPGARVQVQSSHRGLQSRLWKYVYVDGVETEKELLSTDSYMASKAIYRVGPAQPAVAPPQPVVPEITVPPTEAAEPSGPASDGPASAGGQATGPAAGPSGPAQPETAAPAPVPETAPAPAAAPAPAPVPGV